MSLLKKLKNKKERLAANKAAASIPKGVLNQLAALELSLENKKRQFTAEEAESFKNEEYNNVFKLSNSSYILLERYATSLDNLLALRDKTGNSFSKEDALKVYYFEKIIEAIMTGDKHIRDNHIIVQDGVCEMDNAHHAYHQVISEMDKMSYNSLQVLVKAAETINSSKRYMWIDSEESFKTNMELAIQRGIELGLKGRKKATRKDADKFLADNPGGKI